MDELLATCFPCFFRDPNKFERVRRSGSPTGNYDKFEDEEEEFYSTEGDERLDSHSNTVNMNNTNFPGNGSNIILGDDQIRRRQSPTNYKKKKKKMSNVEDAPSVMYRSPTATLNDIESSPIAGGSSCGDMQLMQSLNSDKLVLPGSELQRAIALSMESSKLVTGVVECVICMENFDPQNPQMLTLCGCGMNKTLFHYQCLLEWLSKDPSCPACRNELIWQENEILPPGDDDDDDKNEI